MTCALSLSQGMSLQSGWLRLACIINNKAQTPDKHMPQTWWCHWMNACKIEWHILCLLTCSFYVYYTIWLVIMNSSQRLKEAVIVSARNSVQWDFSPSIRSEVLKRKGQSKHFNCASACVFCVHFSEKNVIKRLWKLQIFCHTFFWTGTHCYISILFTMACILLLTL